MLAALGAAVLIAVSFPDEVLAHNSMESSNIVDGSVLETPPTEWIVVFVKPVGSDAVSGDLIDADGRRLRLNPPSRGASDRELVYALPPLQSGIYTLRWRLVGDDAHVVTGRVRFEFRDVGIPDGAATPSSVVIQWEETDGLPPDEESGSLTLVPFRALGYAALVLLLGLWFVELRVAAGARESSRGRRLGSWSAAVLLATALVEALEVSARQRDVSLVTAIGHLPRLLESSAGSMVAARILVSIALVVFIVASRRSASRSLEYTGFVALAVYPIALAMGGHSRTEGSAWLGVPIDVLHQLSISVWLGGLAVLHLVVLPQIADEAVPRAYSLFGRHARIAVPVIMATGIVQTVRLHGVDLSVFLDTAHGRTLVGKLSLVAAMLVLGDLNRRRANRLVTGNSAPAGETRAVLRRASTVEVAIGGLVLAITARLVETSI